MKVFCTAVLFKMNGAIFYNSYELYTNSANKEKRKAVPGSELFSCVFDVFGHGSSIIDRSRIVTNPIKTDVLPFLEIPEVGYAKEFSDICDKRAIQLLDHVKQTGRQVAVRYSGGIASTLVLAAIVKNASTEDLKLVIVLFGQTYSTHQKLSNLNQHHTLSSCFWHCLVFFRSHQLVFAWYLIGYYYS